MPHSTIPKLLVAKAHRPVTSHTEPRGPDAPIWLSPWAIAKGFGGLCSAQPEESPPNSAAHLPRTVPSPCSTPMIVCTSTRPRGKEQQQKYLSCLLVYMHVLTALDIIKTHKFSLHDQQHIFFSPAVTFIVVFVGLKIHGFQLSRDDPTSHGPDPKPMHTSHSTTGHFREL